MNPVNQCLGAIHTWTVSRGQCPLGSVIWASSCGNHLLGRVLWASSCGQGLAVSLCLMPQPNHQPVPIYHLPVLTVRFLFTVPCLGSPACLHQPSSSYLTFPKQTVTKLCIILQVNFSQLPTLATYNSIKNTKKQCTDSFPANSWLVGSARDFNTVP